MHYETSSTSFFSPSLDFGIEMASFRGEIRLQWGFISRQLGRKNMIKFTEHRNVAVFGPVFFHTNFGISWDVLNARR